MGAGFNRVMDRLCQMEHEQQEIKCLIENTAKD